AEASELVARIFSDDPDDVMPPPDSHRTLTQQEKEILKQWIDEGAHYDQHWSFKPLADPEPPLTEDSSWPRNDIDRFILAKLESENFTPTPEAAKERLLRRLAFDLTGLPPTPEEVADFVSDDSPIAYERRVDDYLSRPEFGERMATPWLDLARYSDTYGFQQDWDRFVWPWRDWVIDALNQNLPYDQFISWQIAGDMLPDASREQILATTFSRLHPQKVEGGSDPEEFRVEYVADRVHTFGTAFLGLTLECSRCHDHRYDPISQKEYYQLFSYFQNIDEAGLYSYFTKSVPTPTLAIPDEKEEAKLRELQSAAKAAENKYRARWSGLEANAPLLEKKRMRELLDSPGTLASFSFEQHKVEEAKKGSLWNFASDSGSATAKAEQRGAQLVPGRSGNALELDGDTAVDFDFGNFGRYEPFSISLWMWTPDLKERAVVFHRSRAWTDAASRGYQLLLEDGKLSASLVHFWPGNAIRVRATEPMPLKEWQHVTITYEGSSRASGLRIFVNGQPTTTEVVRDELTREIRGGGADNIAIGQRFRDRGFTNGRVDDFTVFDRELSELEIREMHSPGSIQAANDIERPLIEEFFRLRASPKMQEAADELKAARKALANFKQTIPEIMVMKEMEEAKPAYLLERGSYMARGETVSPGIPEALQLDGTGPAKNRRDLAEWLVQSPLTARVAVNRHWQILFGEGLVRTPEDFGSQGSAPTHPELLEWLARDFVENGWDVKRLVRQLVTSATYRQDSTLNSDALNRDPENLLLGRSHRFRLPAEMIRDQALAASELLVRDMGGEPAKPMELAESFKPSEPDANEGRFRRSLYTYWRRTGPAPVMMALDAAKRDVCSAKRERTSTPLQALVLLNDPLMLTSAREIAADGLRQQASSANGVSETIQSIFQNLTARTPDQRELEILTNLYTAQKKKFTGNPDAAALAVSADGSLAPADVPLTELAALTLVTNAILNFDEAVMRR
ncbi:MAG: DUF1553 domain-containing protein, partial [Verrucomicrobiota bacterium]